ncbi:MAG: lamin tail domain-containing protein [Methanothrix sp.]|nr:lamin tail domain-containing protein [Methanothrix sp.]
MEWSLGNMHDMKCVSLIVLAFVSIVALCSTGICNIVINEVELSPSDNASKWVEIFNTGDEPVDVSGWMVKIVDGPWTGPIALSSAIEPRGFFVAEGDSRWSAILNGTVFLYDAAGTIVDQTHGLSDSEENDFTWVRMPDGKDTDNKGDFAYFMGSKGRSNGGAVLGRG